MDHLTSLIRQEESENLEFKEQWNDHGLEARASFVNTRGGTLLIGVKDNGTVIGWTGDDRAQQRVINQIVEVLRVQPAVPVQQEQGKAVLVIEVKPKVQSWSFAGVGITSVSATQPVKSQRNSPVTTSLQSLACNGIV